jgi:hypothetical protein
MLNYAREENGKDEKHLTMKLSFCFKAHARIEYLFCCCKLVLEARLHRMRKKNRRGDDWEHDTGLVMQQSSAR